MTIKIDDKVIQAVVQAAAEDPDVALALLKESSLQEAYLTEASEYYTDTDEDNTPTIPLNPDLDHIRYLRTLRRSVKGRKPNPMVVIALHTIFKKWGYNLLAKVVAKVARNMKFNLRTEDVESILKKYGTIIIPFLAVLLVDIIAQYHQVSKETMELDIPFN